MIRTKDFIIDENNILYITKQDSVGFCSRVNYGIEIGIKSGGSYTPFYENEKERNEEFELLWKKVNTL